jgi:HEAT repeat protein
MERSGKKNNGSKLLFCHLVCAWCLFSCVAFSTASPLQNFSEAPQLINALRSDDSRLREEARRSLMALAQSSQTARKSVIRELIRTVNEDQELDGTHRVLNKSFLFWDNVSMIFIKLEAVEATDILVRCINCGNGYTGNFGEPPASVALVRLGRPVLPKLSQELRHEKDRDKRISIAICISRIGGPDATRILRDALSIESDSDVREVIQSSLTEKTTHKLKS